MADRLADAEAHHREALAIAADTSARHQQARAHFGLANVHRRQGDRDTARSHYEQSYAVYAELEMPEAEDVLTYLSIL